ncbi:hypothetical protein [Nocardia sp. NBC_01009]|uniref:hypothetical protein n=1 Tax=Nocardia sp. NBC_01009 TaxID=2975996 RepID=UPI00386FDC3D|nr:hypothetical protein OHA42_26390 [Nocardia sp. NBC_01009]
MPEEGQCEIDAVDLTEPSLSLGSLSAAEQVVFDLGQSRKHLRVDVEHRAPDACLTCPVFITTPEFLPQHREQLELTRGIIGRARERGQLRLAEMNQRTADNLLTIITSLETPSAATDPENNNAC